MKPEPVIPVQLVVCVLERDEALFSEARRLLSEVFGPEEGIYGPWPFDVTDYYEEEMGGPGIRRWLLAHTRPVLSEQLPEIKLHSNLIEERLAESGARKVNLDPGYMDFNKFVLASAKFHEHKIHLGRGIYADLTLLFSSKAWHPLPWSFADFGDHRYDTALTEIRAQYRLKMRNRPEPLRLEAPTAE